MDEEKLIEVGEFYQELNNIIGSNIPLKKIYRSKGLPAHLIKKSHFNCLKHIDDIPAVIRNPDYIGINPNEQGSVIEQSVKVLKSVLLESTCLLRYSLQGGSHR